MIQMRSGLSPAANIDAAVRLIGEAKSAGADYVLTPDTASVPAGDVTFKVKNNGKIAHALEIEGNGVEEKTGNIQPGTGATLRVTLTKDGSYEMYCPIDGHKQNGMLASLTVGGAATGGMTTGETTLMPYWERVASRYAATSLYERGTMARGTGR